MMQNKKTEPLIFEKETIIARFISPDGEEVEREIEIRTNPVTFRRIRVAFSRISEKETGVDQLPKAPPGAGETSGCPFCMPQVTSKTPRFIPELEPEGRISCGDSILFPNLFPYGSYSAVSLFDNRHYVEIGTALLSSYTSSFINCGKYSDNIISYDPEAVHHAITQNHLPSAGGSILHPHLQFHGDRIPSNNHRFLGHRAANYFQEIGSFLFSDYILHEKADGRRYIGNTGSWEWVAAFAPEGFYEFWGILPDIRSLRGLDDSVWEDLAGGILNIQKYYRSICRNGYNLGLLTVEQDKSCLELRAKILARSNYAPWVRNDHTGYEVMLGDMATFTAPEEIAEAAREFW